MGTFTGQKVWGGIILDLLVGGGGGGQGGDSKQKGSKKKCLLCHMKQTALVLVVPLSLILTSA